MNLYRTLDWRRTTLVLVLILVQAFPCGAFAKSPVKLQKFGGTINFSTTEASTFTLNGNASHLGLFNAYGEVNFTPGPDDTLIGTGVAVFTAANGDVLVGNVNWNAAAAANSFRTSDIHFSWSDSVQFSNGTTFTNTGRFVKDRPPGLVVIAIIAILIGLLLPAVQKVR